MADSWCRGRRSRIPWKKGPGIYSQALHSIWLPGTGSNPAKGGISPCGSTMPTPPPAGLIPPSAGLYRLDLPQITTNHSSLDPSLKDHRLASVPALLAPDKPPRSSGDLGSSAQDVFRVIVLPDTALYVIGLTAIVSARTLTLDNVDRMPHRVLKQQSPSQCGGAPDFHGSPGRTRIPLIAGFRLSAQLIPICIQSSIEHPGKACHGADIVR